MSKRSLLGVAFLISLNWGWAQNETALGSFPPVSTFSVNDYKASAQVWSGTQDKEGKMYFANNKGVLMYDGSRWSRLSTHKESRITRVFKAANDSVYLAGENELGEIAFDSLGKPYIIPLLKTKIISYGLGEIWDIEERKDNSILFFGKNGVVSYKKGGLKQLLKLKQGKITASFRMGEGFLISVNVEHSDADLDVRLFYLADGENEFKALSLPVESNFKSMRGVVYVDNKYLLINEKGGVYTAVDHGKGNFAWLKNETVFDGLDQYVVNRVITHKNYVYVATDANGLLIYDKQGKFIRSIAEKEGLLNLSVFDLFFDKNNNLWLMLDNGIGLLELSSPVTYFSGKQGGVLASTEAIAQSNLHQTL